MCGIAGFWQTKRSSQSPGEILARMGQALRHRGPDDFGQMFDTSTGVGFAHRRLSIVDLSPAGHQPMTSSSGRYTITFNGEVYNYEEIRKELGGDHKWNGHSDTEVMLEAVEHWGLDGALQRFVGMFAFALWDHLERKLFLVRDRLGIKPVFYGWVNGDFVFASELKAIYQYPGFEGAIDRSVLALYMRHNYVPSPHCIYQGIYKLAAGHIFVLDSPEGEGQLNQFWSAVKVAHSGIQSPITASDEDAIELLKQELSRSIALRMIADVPVGAFLSGGIDSSAVAALMQAQSTRPVKTFTIGFHEDDFNEAAHAQSIAGHLGTDHTELYVTPKETMDVVPQLADMFDEPFADSSQIPTFLVSKLARQNVIVSLSGDGGDELFAGYNRYLLTKKIWTNLSRVPASIRTLAASAVLHCSPQKIDRFAKVLRPISRHRISAVGDKAHKLAGFFGLNTPQAIYMHALSHWDRPDDIVRYSHEPDTVSRFIEQSASLPSVEEAMMLTDMVHYLPDDILTKVDRASMAVGLEARVPLLDHNVVEFAWKLPLHLKIRDGASKWILRRLLHQYVPSRLTERPKMGFGVPIADWLRGPLRAWAGDLLSSSALCSHDFFSVEPIRKRWQEHLSGTRNWQYQLWNVLIFQDWFIHQMKAKQAA
ncbi:MAG TPA: asparagine synthase (glutamine-hydrolyzing) [Terriglobales bacterium]|nr:asparagine synthase (glutamine-hydrolyzing) [Terriglobales bacterium]